MKSTDAITTLSALAHPQRLAVFRLLVRTGAGGLAAGDIAQRLDTAPSTLSTNLALLQSAGLVRGARHGRSIRYTADMNAAATLIAYLLEDCCGGRPDLCRPVLATLVTASPEVHDA